MSHEYAVELATCNIRFGPGVTRELGTADRGVDGFSGRNGYRIDSVGFMGEEAGIGNFLPWGDGVKVRLGRLRRRVGLGAAAQACLNCPAKSR